MTARLERTTLRTSRLMDFASKKDLIAQTGHQESEWALVLLERLPRVWLSKAIAYLQSRYQ